MILAFTSWDYSILVVYLLSMLAVGAYFSREQHTSKDFFLAGRSMSWLPVGLSIVATLLSALSYTGIPGEAYMVGMLMIPQILSIWLDVPIILWCVLPLYYNLSIYSAYEYLEMRYDLVTRTVASCAFVLWRLLWLGGVIYAPCKVLLFATKLDVDITTLLIVVGALTTLYTFLGGMKAVIWTDAIQFTVMAGGIVMIIVVVWMTLDGGPSRVWEVADQLGRTRWFDLSPDLSVKWSFWAFLPHFFLVRLCFYVADQITVQRFLTTKSLREVQRSFVLNCVSICLMLPALTYIGVSLLAFYHDNAQAEMRPQWVALSAEDPQTGNPMIGRDTVIDSSTISGLVASGAILDPQSPPNDRRPFTSTQGLTDPQTGEVLIDRLAVRNPKTGERMLQRGKDELMPRFIARHLPVGIAGLILAALFAASMSSMDSGLNSISTLLIVDFHRRLGWGRRQLARFRSKPVEAWMKRTSSAWADPWCW